MFVDDHQLNWDVYLPLVMMAYRSTVQETIGVSPNKMMFGREVNLPIDLIVGCPPDSETVSGSLYVHDLQTKIQQAHQHARKHYKVAARRQKKNYDIKASGAAYSRGDFVWLFAPIKKKGLSSKLQRYWEGPYLIVNRLSDALYRIQKSPRTKCKIVHFNRLKKYKGHDHTAWIDSLDPEVRVASPDQDQEKEAQCRPDNWDSESESSDEDDDPASRNAQMSNVDRLSDKEGSEESFQVIPSSTRRSKRIIRKPKRLIEEI